MVVRGRSYTKGGGVQRGLPGNFVVRANSALAWQEYRDGWPEPDRGRFTARLGAAGRVVDGRAGLGLVATVTSRSSTTTRDIYTSVCVCNTFRVDRYFTTALAVWHVGLLEMHGSHYEVRIHHQRRTEKTTTAILQGVLGVRG